MASFSKLVAASSSNVSTKWKQTLTSKLTDENNVDKDTVKRRKLQIQTATEVTQKQTKKTGTSNRRASVEAIKEKETTHCNAGIPENPNFVIEAADGSDNVLLQLIHKHVEEEDKDVMEVAEGQNETEEDELSEFGFNTNIYILTWYHCRMSPKRLAIPHLCIFPCQR